jgi:hypothetical protein
MIPAAENSIKTVFSINSLKFEGQIFGKSQGDRTEHRRWSSIQISDERERIETAEQLKSFVIIDRTDF